jgi:hypothetical protein
MKECICSTCVNLLEIVNEQGPTGDFECEHGYPGEQCESCETQECDLECKFYKSEDEAETLVTVQCKICGKSMQGMAADGDDGDVFCIDCYLKK